MRVEFQTAESAVEPRMLVQYEQHLTMALRPGCVEVGQKHSEMKKINVEAGEVNVCPPPGVVWHSWPGEFDPDHF